MRLALITVVAALGLTTPAFAVKQHRPTVREARSAVYMAEGKAAQSFGGHVRIGKCPHNDVYGPGRMCDVRFTGRMPLHFRVLVVGAPDGSWDVAAFPPLHG